MLKVSRRLNYGLQLMLALATDTENTSKSTSIISEKLSIPVPFLHQIAHTLQQNGLIKATPGPKGGLRLGSKGLEITLFDIVNALEGQFSIPTIDSDVNTGENDTAMELWKEIGLNINNLMKEYKLSDLLER